MYHGRNLLPMAFFLSAVAGSVLSGCGPQPPAGGGPGLETRPNIILISLDTLRADHLSAYGYHRETSPRLEELADDGVLFEKFIHNGGNTLPSHMTMLTSLHPTTHGIWPKSGQSLHPGWVTLAEHLRGDGYTTAAFVDGGYMRARYGFSQGFDLYDEAGKRFVQILPRAEDWLGRNYDRPFFLLLHTFDIHSEWRQLPYDCPGEYPRLFTSSEGIDFDGCRDGECASRLLTWTNRRIKNGEVVANEAFSEREIEFIKALYDGCIRYTDDQVGGFLNRLKKLNLYDNSLIVVTSDHGEEFAEHGLFLHNIGRSYESVVHVPLIVKFPRSRFRGRRVPHVAAMVDLMPTLLDIVGVPVDSKAEGRSLMPAVLEDRPIRREVHTEAVLRTEEWKYFHNLQELYNLRSDPAEQKNLIGEGSGLDPELIENFLRQLEREKKLGEELVGSTPSRPGVELSEKEVRELRALGYLE